MKHLECSISTQKEYVLGNELSVKISVKNVSEENIALLKWNTPFEGLLSHVFKINIGENQALPYDGILIKRGNPQKKDFIMLKPGEEITQTVDITNAYFINQVTNHEIKVDFMGLYFVSENNEYPDTSGSKKPYVVHLESEGQIIKITPNNSAPKMTTGMVARLHDNHSLIPGNKFEKSSPSLGQTLRPVFIGGSKAEQDTVTINHFKAKLATGESLNNLKVYASSENRKYIEWFGMQEFKRYLEVMKVYGKIKDSFETVTITYNLEEGRDMDCYGYTFKNSSKIWLCKKFWTAPDSGFDTKFGTIVHEMSHCRASTDDIVYGVQEARDLARIYPDKAIENADSYEYFTESL